MDSSKGLSGVAGEYLVAGELSRRGYMASVTLRNSVSIDIHASKISEGRIFAIQVKTRQFANRGWPLNQKAVLERPDYLIVPSEIVATRTKEGHAKWLTETSKNGKPHKDTPMRMFFDKEGDYLERWDLLQ